MSDLIKTRCGLEPSLSELPFTITTVDCERYLQAKLKFRNYSEDDYKILLLSLNLSKIFVPLVLLLPDYCMANEGDSEDEYTQEKYIPSGFLQNEQVNSNRVRLKKDLYKTIIPYMYTDDDEKAFFSNQFKQHVGITQGDAITLKKLRVPTIYEDVEDKIAVLIDPVRLFTDMLTDQQNLKERFAIKIPVIEINSNSRARYKVLRIANKVRVNDSSKKSLSDEQIINRFKNTITRNKKR